jgi:hypothetical protein
MIFRSMSFSRFLTNLLDNGTVQVSKALEIPPAEKEESQRLLTEFERVFRLSLAGEPPPLDVGVAGAAAQTLYRLCQCLVHREFMPQETLAQADRLPDAPRTPGDHYSADLTFRFLPDVWRLTKEAAEGDPLVTTVRQLAGRWPLSSVGMPDLPAPAIDGIAEHPALLALYVDRIIQRRDRSRLSDPRLREAFLAAIGAHRELAPELMNLALMNWDTAS